MKEGVSRINFPVDPANPGQFFACCGLLEIADRLWPGVEGYFDGNEFVIIHEDTAISLARLLDAAHNIQLAKGKLSVEENDEDEEETAEAEFKPLIIESPVNLHLDWWQDKTLKPWAGSMNAQKIFLAMCSSIDSKNKDPLNQGQIVFDEIKSEANDNKRKQTKPTKREPFYFDSRRGANALPIDVGFSPDTLKLTTIAYPVVEALSFIGLQRFRPKPTDKSRIFEYFLWNIPMPVEVIPVAVLGIIGNGRGYRFENIFRTDQKKHKAFAPAKLIRGELYA